MKLSRLVENILSEAVLIRGHFSISLHFYVLLDFSLNKKFNSVEERTGTIFFDVHPNVVWIWLDILNL